MLRQILIVVATICSWAAPARAVELEPLWDFQRPDVSEQRLRTALQSAAGDDALILKTQIARTYVLRKDFDKAREILEAMQLEVEAAGPEAKVRFWLELGRTYASHQHPPDSQTAETKALARRAYTRALTVAEDARLDGLAIDAVHMFPFVDTDPAHQYRWGTRALAMIEASDQPQAKRWEASIRNNLGEALFELGRYDEALVHFRRALALREQESNALAARAAHWHVARVLRMLDQTDEAIAIQLRLEREADAANDPRSWIFEELEILYRSRGDVQRAQRYAKRKAAIAQ